jgi:hypothetical protein
VTIDGVWDWILDLLTTYTRNSEVQVITATSLISTLYKSPQHTLNILQPVFIRRSLVTVSNSGNPTALALKFSLNGGSLPTDSFLHRLPYRTDLVAPIVFLITPRHGPRRKHAVHSLMLTFPAAISPRHPATGSVTPFIKNPLPQQRSLFHDRHPATGLHATL